MQKSKHAALAEKIAQRLSFIECFSGYFKRFGRLKLNSKLLLRNAFENTF
jgi:hypothetical protein